MGMTFDPSKLVANMEAIRAKVAGEGRRRAVIAGAEVIGEAMVERAPVLDGKTPGSDSLEPGDIRDGIKAWGRQIDGEPVGFVGPVGKDGNIPKVAYLVEYGHRMVTGGKSTLGPDGKFRGGGKVSEQDVPAHPFLRPAFESSAAAAVEAVGEMLGQEMREAVKNA